MASTVDTIDYWESRWKEQRTRWQLEKVNPILIEFLDRLSPSGTPKKFFLPLCGASYDIKYLYDQGHSVFAVEGVKIAIEDLNKRDNLNLVFSEGDSTYSSPDGRIVIYVGDIYECPVEKWGPVDVVWDRGSFIAIGYSRREAYVEVIKRSVQKSKDEYADFRILLDTVFYEKDLFEGPPHSVDPEEVNKLYSDWANVELVRKEEEGSSTALRSVVPVGHYCYDIVYLLTPK